MGFINPRTDPPRDEDYEDGVVVEITNSHSCDKFTEDSWMCSDCGTLFPRDPAMGDFPEQAIIEGECKEYS